MVFAVYFSSFGGEGDGLALFLRRLSAFVSGGFWFLQWLPRRFVRRRFPARLLVVIVGVLFGLPMSPRLAIALEDRLHLGGLVALELVERMRSANVGGAIAEDGMLMGSWTGLYLACLLNKRWFSGSPDATGMDYLSRGAEIVVRRQHRVNDEMKLNPAFRDLDAVLFSEEGEGGVLGNLAGSFPLQVYQIER